MKTCATNIIRRGCLVALLAQIGSAQLQEEQKLLASDGSSGDGWGAPAAFDGRTAAIGSLATTEESVYVFERLGTAWHEAAKLVSPAPAAGFFGASLDVQNNDLVIGAPDGSQLGAPVGLAYVYERTSGTWALTATVTAADGLPGDAFGSSVALHGDILAVGAPGRDDANPGGTQTESGGVYLFQKSGGGWNQIAKLTPSDTAPGDTFGGAVDIGLGRVIASSLGDDLGGGSLQGSVYVFEGGGSSWTETVKLVASNGSPLDKFGCSLAFEEDLLLVGAPGVPGGGAVYSLRRTTAGWIEEEILQQGGSIRGDRFGRSLQLSGSVALVGAPASDLGGQDAGTAFVYLRGLSSWTRVAQLVRTDPSPFDAFGIGVALHGDIALVGSPQDDDSGAEAGAAYVFRPPVPFAYCTGRTNSLGCVPFASASGIPSATNTEAFRVEASNTLPNEAAFLFYGFKKANLNFHGGKLCIKPPFVRLLPLKQAKASGAPPCTGRLFRNFNSRIQSGWDPLLTVGQVVRAQWLQRDPGNPFFGDTLTDALQFTILP